ncbi:MAG: hypothetical protein WKF84_17025 [Pyrinomonadaceae bacterium]
MSIVAGTRARFLIAVAMAFALGFLAVWLASRRGSTQATSIANTEQEEGSRTAAATDERAALRAALNEWTSTTNQGDFARLAMLYMPQVTTFT